MKHHLVHCRLCGGRFKTNFSLVGSFGFGPDKECCCEACYNELLWVKTLAAAGEDYYPKPSAMTETHATQSS